ncbi:hypothetical protein Emag_006995 [Eimeria magna]
MSSSDLQGLSDGRLSESKGHKEGTNREETHPFQPVCVEIGEEPNPRCPAGLRTNARVEAEAPDEALRLHEKQPSRVWLAEVWIANRRYEALVDSGATRSFTLPSVAVEAELATEPLDEAVEFCVATGAPFQVRTVAQDVTYYWGRNKHAKAKGSFLVAYIPYPLILGTDCLHELKALWDLAKGVLRLSAFQPPIDVSLIERSTQGAKRGVQALAKGENVDDKRLAEEAKGQMERDIKDLSSPAATRGMGQRTRNYQSSNSSSNLRRMRKNMKNWDLKRFQRGTEDSSI